MKTIVCYGDSNTYGYNPENGFRYEYEERWTTILQKELKDSAIVIPEGLNGRTTSFEDELRPGRNGATYLDPCLHSHGPIDLVVLMLGTNDCKTFYNASAEVIGLGVERLVEQIRKADKNIRILLISPIQLGEGVWEQGYDPEFNEKSVEVSKGLKAVYQKVAEKYGCDFLADVAEPSKEDREHLNEEGHKKLAEAVLEVLAA